jgi:hypothetical protein
VREINAKIKAVDGKVEHHHRYPLTPQPSLSNIVTVTG